MQPSSVDRRLPVLSVYRFAAAAMMFLPWMLQAAPAISAVNLQQVDRWIDAYHLSSAQPHVPDDTATTPMELYVRGKYLFFMGRYDEAREALQRAIDGHQTDLDWKLLQDRVLLSLQVRQQLVEHAMPDGKAVYYHADGLDRILIPLAHETFLQQRAALEETLGDRLTNVRIYLVPTTEMLSELSGLPVDQIEITGTVAVTRYNRIMMLTPREIQDGYPWRDTLAHEMTHLSISRVSMDQAPIWIHEGIARLLEANWRGGDGAGILPESAYLLDRAAREGRLIPLRRLHPSVAYLPSQEDAALAYAQVQSFFTYLTNRMISGYHLQDLLQMLAKGQSVDQALKATTGHDLKKLYRWWQTELRGVRQAPSALVPLMKRKYIRGEPFRKGSMSSFLASDVRNSLRVGDLLRMRGHLSAALQEYESAMKQSDVNVPDIFDRMAGVLLQLGRPEDALRSLDRIRRLYPQHSAVYFNTARAWMQMNESEKAIDNLMAVLSLQPFHPDVHCLLYELHNETKSDLAAVHRQNCMRLGNAP